MTSREPRDGAAQAASSPEEESVYRVAPFTVPDAEGGWPCGCCGTLFPVSESWRVTLERSGTLITCSTCAERARRQRKLRRASGRRHPLARHPRSARDQEDAGQPSQPADRWRP